MRLRLIAATKHRSRHKTQSPSHNCDDRKSVADIRRSRISGRCLPHKPQFNLSPRRACCIVAASRQPCPSESIVRSRHKAQPHLGQLPASQATNQSIAATRCCIVAASRQPCPSESIVRSRHKAQPHLGQLPASQTTNQSIAATRCCIVAASRQPCRSESIVRSRHKAQPHLGLLPASQTTNQSIAATAMLCRRCKLPTVPQRVAS